jgi:parvulin-like peptidyl-prolyl isomerase
VQIYYQKRVIPLIQVTAADMRTYYALHKDIEFTTHGQARFRIIKIDPAQHLGREDALNIAESVRKRAATEDFADLAKSVNDDATWRASAGAVGDIQKGAFRVPDVEEAVWKLRPGEVSDIIPAEGCFYIVKLERLTEDKVEDFDSEKVQDRIRDELRSQQFTALREKHDGELKKEAITRRNIEAINETFASIVQQYPAWRAAK